MLQSHLAVGERIKLRNDAAHRVAEIAPTQTLIPKVLRDGVLVVAPNLSEIVASDSVDLKLPKHDIMLGTIVDASVALWDVALKCSTGKASAHMELMHNILQVILFRPRSRACLLTESARTPAIDFCAVGLGQEPAAQAHADALPARDPPEAVVRDGANQGGLLVRAARRQGRDRRLRA